MLEMIGTMLVMILTILFMYCMRRGLDFLIELDLFKKKKNLKNFLETILPLMFCNDKIILSVFYEDGFHNYTVSKLNTKEKQKKLLGELLKYKVVRIYEYKSGIEIVLMKESGYGG